MQSRGQLVLPEGLKMVPLMLSAMFKLPAFRDRSDVRVGDAVAQLTALWRMPTSQLISFLYPNFYPVHNMNVSCGMKCAKDNSIYVPATVPATSGSVTSTGMYIVENGNALFLWIGDDVRNTLLNDMFGVWSLDQVDATAELESDPNTLSGRILAIIEELRIRRAPGPRMPLKIILPGTTDDARMHALLVEDGYAGEQPYVDFLCDLHQRIQNREDQVWW